MYPSCRFKLAISKLETEEASLTFLLHAPSLHMFSPHPSLARV